MGKMLRYENEINKNFNKTRKNILNMYGSEALQFFDPLKRALKINFESFYTNCNCFLMVLNHCHEYKQVSWSIKNAKNEANNWIKAEIVSCDGRYMTYKSSTVKQRVKSLPETIIIIGDQLKPQENIPDYLKIYEESNLFILVLITLLISGLDYSMSPFRFCSSNWLNYDGLASIKNKSCEKTYYFK